MKGLYIHIPFCKNICSYCDFTKIIAREDVQVRYISRLIKELHSYRKELSNIDTVYIGGGTPNVLPLYLLKKLFLELKDILDKACEKTIELNPEWIKEDLLDLLKEFGFNRLSIGMQTINEEAIRLIRRKHNKEIVKQAVELCVEKGFKNINVDLIYGIPQTTLKTVEEDLDFVLSLPIQHISCYSLILENRTILMKQIQSGEMELLEEDMVADMYDYINDRLKKSEFKRYEISNYAKEGYESKHNMLYWTGQEYVGIGCGACGYIHSIRIDNEDVLNRYFESFVKSTERIDVWEQKREFFLLGLRMVEGVSKKKYKELFDTEPEKDFDFTDLVGQGLLIFEGDRIYIPEQRLEVANMVFEKFVEVEP